VYVCVCVHTHTHKTTYRSKTSNGEVCTP
jgi:hypothetical protein